MPRSVPKGSRLVFTQLFFSAYGYCVTSLLCIIFLIGGDPKFAAPTMMSKYAKHGLQERKDYMYKLIVTVYEICLEDLAFMKIKSLVEMQAKNGVEVGSGSAYTNYSFVIAIVEILSCYFKDAQDTRLKQAKLLAIAGDGSATRADEDSKIIHVKYRDDGKMLTEFYDLLEINSDDGKEGTTADSGALFSTYRGAFEKRGILDFDSLSELLISLSFDGANVMFGRRDSVASRFQERAPKVQSCNHVFFKHSSSGLNCVRINVFFVHRR